jgi:outer membrane protein assembly factor BamB
MTSDGSNIWAVDVDFQSLVTVDGTTGAVSQGPFLGFNPVGVAFDGVGGFYVSEQVAIEEGVAVPSPIHHIVGGADTGSFMPMLSDNTQIISGGLGFDPVTGNLWIGSDSGKLYEFNLSTLLVVRSFSTGDERFIDGLEYQVPEPATLSLLGFGLLGFAALRKRIA